MNEDFERQLLLELKEKELKEKEFKEEKDNPYLSRDPNDGTLYEWNPIKKLWFPKIDDNFLALYQNNNYQYVETETDIEKKKELQNSESSKKNEKNEKNIKINESEPTWFEVDEEQNTKVYVSNLPENINEQEFVELMQKCGLIMKDDETRKFKVKLYLDINGELKGDALCSYIKPESVKLALQILDGYTFKNKVIKVERAKFQLKGEFDPSKKPRKRKAKDKEKMRKKINKLFSWQPEKLPNERSNHEKVVIIKNFFDISEFDKDPTLISEYRIDILDECNEKCGPVKKIDIYDRNPDGVVAVFFKEFEHADICVNLMNGRFFAGRQLSAENWDGRTKYKIEETEEQAKSRIDKWNKYLESE